MICGCSRKSRASANPGWRAMQSTKYCEIRQGFGTLTAFSSRRGSRPGRPRSVARQGLDISIWPATAGWSSTRCTSRRQATRTRSPTSVVCAASTRRRQPASYGFFCIRRAALGGSRPWRRRRVLVWDSHGRGPGAALLRSLGSSREHLLHSGAGRAPGKGRSCLRAHVGDLARVTNKALRGGHSRSLPSRPGMPGFMPGRIHGPHSA